MEGLHFGIQDELPEERLETQATHHLQKRVVCTFWLRNECTRGDACDWLHAIDAARMPECPRGWKCREKDTTCKYKHTPEEEKEECVNYRLGFCSFGSSCKARHKALPPEDLPLVSEAWLAHYIAEAMARKQDAENSAQFRVSLCKKYTEGLCPYFDLCCYAHGQEQVRRPRTGEAQQRREAGAVRYTAGGDAGGQGGARLAGQRRGREEGAGPGGLSDAPPVQRARVEGSAAGSNGEPPRADSRLPFAPAFKALLEEYATGAGEALSLPDRAGRSKYFVMRTDSGANLLASLKRGEWVTPARYEPVLAKAQANSDRVFLFFAVVGEKHMQGVALVTGPARPVAAPHLLTGPAVPSPEAANGFISIPIQWLRTCTLPFTHLRMVRNLIGARPNNQVKGPIGTPGAIDYQHVSRSVDWQELGEHVGKALMLCTYKAPETAIDVSGIPEDAAFSPFDLTLPVYRQALEEEDVGFDAFRCLVTDVAITGNKVPPREDTVAVAAALAAMAPRPRAGGRFGPLPGGAGAAGVAAGPAPGGSGGPAAGLLPPPMLLPPTTDPETGAPVMLPFPALPALLGAPANPTILGLLNGLAPAGMQVASFAADAFVRGLDGVILHVGIGAPPVQADDLRAFASGVFTLPRPGGPHGPIPAEVVASAIAQVQETVQPGTPVFIFNAARGMLSGLFLARGAAARGLAPAVVPAYAAGAASPDQAPVQLQVLPVSEPLFLPAPAVLEALQLRPDQPVPMGRASAAVLRALAERMFSLMPPLAALQVSALLLQMQEVGMPQHGLLGGSSSSGGEGQQ